MYLCYKNKSLSEYPCNVRNSLYMKILGSRRYITSHKLFPQCIVFNECGNISSNDVNTKIYYMGFMKKLLVWFHEANEIPIGDHHMSIEESKQRIDNSITFNDKQEISRLPPPYPSACSSEEEGDNLLPGQYTQSKCRYTCKFRHMIDECGAVLDDLLEYAPSLKELLPKTNNRTIDEVRQCLVKVILDKSYTCNCKMSCHETNIKHRHITKPTTRLFSYLHFKYDSNTYMEIKEIPAYPATKFITDIGGWMGLFSGMSFLSVVEVLLFIILSVIAMMRKIKHAIRTRRGIRNTQPPM